MDAGGGDIDADPDQRAALGEINRHPLIALPAILFSMLYQCVHGLADVFHVKNHNCLTAQFQKYLEAGWVSGLSAV